MSGTTIRQLRYGQRDAVLEAKVYRKWICKTIREMKEQYLCCMLIDREGNVIQANMDVSNKNYFDERLMYHKAYRIFKFFFEKTKDFQQTLENPVSLRFGKITKFDILTDKESEFPDHHFEFLPYSQLASRIPYPDANSKMVYPILTGRIQSISDLLPFKDNTMGQRHMRKIAIENLIGNVVELTMWDDMAKKFQKEAIERTEPPYIIAVSSCSVSRYRDIQLQATPATFYYVNNKNMPETVYLLKEFKEKHDSVPPLQVAKYRFEDPDKEILRNRETLASLLQQNPSSYEEIHFTCAATIKKIHQNMSWNYASCKQCKKMSTEAEGIYSCEDHGIQDPVTYRYNYKATVADETANAYFTFFSTAGEKMTGCPCTELVAKYADSGVFPTEIAKTAGRRQIFKIRFSTRTTKGAGKFAVEDVLDVQNYSTGTSGTQAGSSSGVSNVTENDTITQETTDHTEMPGTPPADVIDEAAEKVVKVAPKESAAKRSFDNALSAEAKKNKSD